MILLINNGKTIGCDTIAAAKDKLVGMSGKVELKLGKGANYGTLDFSDIHNLEELTLDGDGGGFLTGAGRVSLRFTRYSDTIISAYLGFDYDFERIGFLGRTLTMARYPSYNPALPLGGGVTLHELNARASRWTNHDQIFVRGLHSHEWGGNSYRVSGYSKGELKLDWIGDNNRGSESRYMLAENIFEELDSPDEWYYDKTSGKIYIYHIGDIPPVMSVDLLANTRLLNIHNCSTRLIVKNVDFVNSDRSMYKSKWQRYLRSDWAFNDDAVVVIDKSSNILFSNCKFVNLGSTAMLIRGYNDNINISHCDFINSLSNGIVVLGDPDSTYAQSCWDGDNHLRECDDNSPVGTKSDNYPRNINIKSCYFTNLGIEDKQSAAICISLAHKVSVDRCTIHKMPRAGINICENAFGGHTVSNCDIFDCVRETNDHGPFNSWGRDRFWSAAGYNTTGKNGLKVKPYALLDMLDHNTIRHNRIVGSGVGFGIDLDDGSSNYVIEDNICINVGIKLREGFYRRVSNNYIINAPIDLHATYAGNDDVITNNLIYSKHPIRLALLNKGYTTRFENNYLLKSARAALSNKVAAKYRNNLFNCDVNQLLAQTHSLPTIKRVSPVDFGRSGCPTPPLDCFDVKLDKLAHRNKYGTFSSLDDTLRSLTGASSYDGLYIVKLPILSRLKREFGIMRGDLIIKTDTTTFTTPDSADYNKLHEASQLVIVRNQQQMVVIAKHSRR